MPFLTDEVAQQAEHAVDHFGKSFDCKACGSHFTPRPDQWIFYDLCDTCFAPFDSQKMKGRFGVFGLGPPSPYTESVDEWIQARKGSA